MDIVKDFANDHPIYHLILMVLGIVGILHLIVTLICKVTGKPAFEMFKTPQSFSKITDHLPSFMRSKSKTV
uniref:Uncharacterized protein n=1 Tax=viral metagenome TaxID=1070528 RepID=A0A6C0JTQ6_9ZZZZ